MIVRANIGGASSKEDAVKLFWERMRTANGTRRTAPESLLTIRRVVMREGTWAVHYEVPARIVREIIGGKTRNTTHSDDNRIREGPAQPSDTRHSSFLGPSTDQAAGPSPTFPNHRRMTRWTR